MSLKLPRIPSAEPGSASGGGGGGGATGSAAPTSVPATSEPDSYALGSHTGAPPPASSSAAASTEFVNEGLQYWTALRADWTSPSPTPALLETIDSPSAPSRSGSTVKAFSGVVGTAGAGVSARATSHPVAGVERGGFSFGRRKAQELDVDLIEQIMLDRDRVKPLPHPLALAQMIDCLVELWEAEGLFD